MTKKNFKKKKGYSQNYPKNSSTKRAKGISPELRNEVSTWFEKPSPYKRILFSIIWLYGIVRVFITDFDLIVFSEKLSVQREQYILLRLLIAILAVLLLWLKKGNKQFWKNVGLFLLFPLYPFFFNILKKTIWDLPKFLIERKLPSLLLWYIDTLITFIAKFKITITKAALFFLALILMTFSKPILLWLAIVTLIALQFLHLQKRFQETFGPLRLFQIKLEVLANSNPFSREKFDENINSISTNRSNEKDPEISKIEHFLLIAEFSRIFNKKINEILSSKSYLKNFIFKALFSFFISIVFFGGINYCLFKLSEFHFAVENNPRYFEFFYYSFFTIFPDGTDIEPITRLAKFFRMMGVSVGIVINLLVLTVYFTVRTNRYEKNLETLSNWSYQYSYEVSKYFEEKYQRKMTAGFQRLKETGSQLAQLIEKLKDYFDIKD